MDAINEAARTPCYLPTKKLKDLHRDDVYIVTEVKQVSTRYGMKVVLQINKEFDVFMPNKVNAYLTENETAYNNFSEETKRREVTLNFLGGCLIEFR